MAKSRSRGARGSARGAGAQRAVKSTSQGRRPAAAQVAEVEIVEESRGAGWEGGVAVATFIGLLLAILMVDKHMATYFGEGFLF